MIQDIPMELLKQKKKTRKHSTAAHGINIGETFLLTI